MKPQRSYTCRHYKLSIISLGHENAQRRKLRHYAESLTSVFLCWWLSYFNHAWMCFAEALQLSTSAWHKKRKKNCFNQKNFRNCIKKSSTVVWRGIFKGFKGPLIFNKCSIRYIFHFYYVPYFPFSINRVDILSHVLLQCFN